LHQEPFTPNAFPSPCVSDDTSPALPPHGGDYRQRVDHAREGLLLIGARCLDHHRTVRLGMSRSQIRQLHAGGGDSTTPHGMVRAQSGAAAAIALVAVDVATDAAAAARLSRPPWRHPARRRPHPHRPCEPQPCRAARISESSLPCLAGGTHSGHAPEASRGAERQRGGRSGTRADTDVPTSVAVSLSLYQPFLNR
jgi:hypothetical protein